MKSKYAVLELKYDDTLHYKYLPYVMVWESDILVPYLITGLIVRNFAGADKNKILYVGTYSYNGPSVTLKVSRRCKKRLMCSLSKLNRRVVFQ
jgi:hypothetical protein